MRESSRNAWLHRYAVLCAIAAFCLIVAGALVTSASAGDSISAWPFLPNNELVPATWAGGVGYEYFHRVIAGTLALLVFGLAVWLWRVEQRASVRLLGYAVLVLVLAEAALGAIRVLAGAASVAIFHAAMSWLVFCATVVIAAMTAPDWGEEPLAEDAASGRIPLFDLAAATTAIIYTQSVLGAALRHRTLTVGAHVVGSVVVAVLGVFVIARVLARHVDNRGLRHSGLFLAWLLALQMVLGAGAYSARFLPSDIQPLSLSLGFTTAHVAAGALLFAVGTVLTLRARRSPTVVGTPAPVSRGPQIAGKTV